MVATQLLKKYILCQKKIIILFWVNEDLDSLQPNDTIQHIVD